MKITMRPIVFAIVALLTFGNVFSQRKKDMKLTDDQRMEWWRDSKFGMFIHWGAYSIVGGERGTKIAGGGAEWAMDKLD